MTVLASLCGELKALTHEAKTRFYQPLLLYDEGLMEVDIPEGQVQLRIGRMLLLLQDVGNFVQRANEVILHVVHQVISSFNHQPSLLV